MLLKMIFSAVNKGSRNALSFVIIKPLEADSMSLPSESILARLEIISSVCCTDCSVLIRFWLVLYTAKPINRLPVKITKAKIISFCRILGFIGLVF